MLPRRARPHGAGDDVEGSLQVALRGADVEPVATRVMAVESVADQRRPDLALERHRTARGDQLDDAALEDVGARADVLLAGAGVAGLLDELPHGVVVVG